MRTYHPGRKLGHGGMGEVYEGRMELALGQELPCAIKLIRKDHSTDPEFQRAFAREATTALKVHHQHLIGAYDFGTASDGRVFLVMELVRGPHLHAVADQLADAPTLRRIARDVLMALDYLHSRRLIHRDITPRNILLDDEGCARLADFGIVKRASGTDVHFRGVSGYASPEVRAGGSATTASDLYSLGAVLFRLLTGQKLPHPRPKVGETAALALPEGTPDDLVQLLRGLLREEPEERLTVAEAIQLLEGSDQPCAEREELAEIGAIWLDERDGGDEATGATEHTQLALHGAILRFEAQSVLRRRARRRWLAGIVASAALAFAVGTLYPREGTDTATQDVTPPAITETETVALPSADEADEPVSSDEVQEESQTAKPADTASPPRVRRRRHFGVLSSFAKE